jgi:hypothetical protein
MSNVATVRRNSLTTPLASSRPASSEKTTIVGRTLLCSLIVTASAILFAASLPLDGYYTGNSDKGSPCYLLLLLGWLGVFDGIVAWFASPFLVFSWMFIWFRSLRFVSLGCILLAICLSLSFLLQPDVLKDEGGNRIDITGYGLGYWLWVASISVVVLGNLILIWIGSKTPDSSKCV